MLIGGLEAVLVKTAGAGLVPDKHLGMSKCDISLIFDELLSFILLFH
jgi:hypothetical protein